MSWFRRHDDWRPVEDVDLDSLLALVADNLGYRCDFAADGATLELSGPRRITVRLAGLRREAGRRSREDWPKLAAAHLRHAVADAGRGLDVCDLAQARPLLRTRVYLEDDLPAAGITDPTRVIGRHLTAELVELLTVGYGGSVRPVRPEEAFCWPIPPGQALDVAAANVLADERLRLERADLGGGVTVSLLTGSTASAVAHLRYLETYLAVPRGGVLVALLHPGGIAVHPIDGLGVVRALERLRLHAQQYYDTHPEGVSPYVYWWCGDRLTHIKADLVAQEGRLSLVVSPPPEFARLIARFAA